MLSQYKFYLNTLRSISSFGLRVVVLIIVLLSNLSSFSQDSLAVNKFRFIDVKVDSTGLLTWKTKNEPTATVYYVQRYCWNKWITTDTINADSSHSYSSKVVLHSGSNKFIVSTSFNSSNTIEYDGKNLTELFLPQKLENVIRLKRISEYEIFDQMGNSVLKGKSDDVNVSELKKGAYYLQVENRMTEFLKK